MDTDKIKYKNTVLLVEPRNIPHVFVTLDNAYNVLKNDWHYIFYCGKSVYDEFKTKIPHYVELRQLDSDNWPNGEYSTFFKNLDLWNSLHGDFILTIQLDVWLFNIYPYTIEYFLKQDRSYIGGNMAYPWKELIDSQIYPTINNFNGGLSLRKREDMIKIINYFNELNDQVYNNYPEDVYFTIGCYKLQLKTGDEEETSRFSIQCIYYDKFFGVHHLWDREVQRNVLHKYPHLLDINPYVCGSIVSKEKLSKPYNVSIQKRINIDNTLIFPSHIKLYNC